MTASPNGLAPGPPADPPDHSWPPIEERLRLALEAAAMGTWSWDPETDVIRADARAREIFGVRGDDIGPTGLRLLEIVHPDDRHVMRGAIRECVDPEGGGAFECEHRVRRGHGEPDVVWVRHTGKARFDEVDGKQYATLVVGTVLDVTAEREAIQAARESERRLHAVLDQMPSGVLIAEAPSGRLLYRNDEAVRVLGHDLPADVPLPEAPFGALHDDGTPYAADEYPTAKALAGAAPHEEEMRYRRGDGTIITLAVRAAPVRESDGEVARVVATFQDISEVARVRDELREAKEGLERRVHERTRQVREQEAKVREMASRLAVAEREERRRIAQVLHDDLQQVLYAVEMKVASLSSSLARSDQGDLASDADEARSWVRHAVNTARRLTVDLSPPIVEKRGLTESLEWLRGHMKELHGLDVHLDVERDWYVADDDLRVLLFQTVRELLFNVTKHAGAGEATVRLTEARGALAIHVIDDGRGFRVEDVLDEDAPTDRYGLFSIKERLALHGGGLEIDSAPGRGTHAEVRAPVRAESHLDDGDEPQAGA